MNRIKIPVFFCEPIKSYARNEQSFLEFPAKRLKRRVFGLLSGNLQSFNVFNQNIKNYFPFARFL